MKSIRGTSNGLSGKHDIEHPSFVSGREYNFVASRRYTRVGLRKETDMRTLFLPFIFSELLGCTCSTSDKQR